MTTEKLFTAKSGGSFEEADEILKIVKSRITNRDDDISEPD